jgi:hypothetical protein
LVEKRLHLRAGTLRGKRFAKPLKADPKKKAKQG